MATKKIKKVETPIDNKETFVSLQKTFADSGLGVEEKLRTLYELQKADTEIDKIFQLRGELPAEVENLEAELAAVEAKVAQGTEVVEKFNANIAANKQNMLDLDEEIARYQHQLENISNSREFDSINKEIENQGYLRQICEKNINDARAAIALKKAEIEDAKVKIDILTEDLKAKKEELASIVESTAADEARLVARRDACAAKIDERTMSAYTRIRASVRNHLAVVSVFGELVDPQTGKVTKEADSCGGCFSTITPQRLVDIASNKKLIICEHCGRIIVNPDFSAGESEQ